MTRHSQMPTPTTVSRGIRSVLNILTLFRCFNHFNRQGEISALINLARTLGGFAVAYFQVPWATKNGAQQTFGCEAAIVAGLFILLIPLLQWKGRSFRVCFAAI